MSVPTLAGWEVVKRTGGYTDMLNIFKHKSRQSINKKTAAEIKAIQKDIQTASEQYEATRQQLLKNLATINSIL